VGDVESSVSAFGHRTWPDPFKLKYLWPLKGSMGKHFKNKKLKRTDCQEMVRLTWAQDCCRRHERRAGQVC
jgi:hypothetical protein